MLKPWVPTSFPRVPYVLARNALVVACAALVAYSLEVAGYQPFLLTGETARGLPPIRLPPFSVPTANGTVSFTEMVQVSLGRGTGLHPPPSGLLHPDIGPGLDQESQLDPLGPGREPYGHVSCPGEVPQRRYGLICVVKANSPPSSFRTWVLGWPWCPSWASWRALLWPSPSVGWHHSPMPGPPAARPTACPRPTYCPFPRSTQVHFPRCPVFSHGGDRAVGQDVSPACPEP